VSEQIIVTIKHVQACSMCVRGARQWFERHGLDFREFLLKGLPIEKIEATGDAMGRLVADYARKEVQGEEP